MIRFRGRTGLVAAGAGLALVATWLTGRGPAEAVPNVSVTTVVSGLTHPWDLTWVGDVMLYDQRGGGVWSKSNGAAPQPVQLPMPPLFVNSEAGLMGIVADPEAATNAKFYTCQATQNGGRPDVRVLRWRLTSATTAVSEGTPLVTGLPISSGRHSGCRLRFGADGMLYVGTGDAAVGANPQNRQSLGGKVLRVAADGTVPTDNPFYAEGGNARYVWTFGHRNVQGLALRPGTTQLWSQEQGTSRDDEFNRLSRGANYGYDPVPGYNESVPMTDRKKYPQAIGAAWSSGSSTRATSGVTFLTGAGWGSWEGDAAVAMLKDTGILLLNFDAQGRAAESGEIPGLSAYGRIRTVQMGPDGALWFTTSNGSNDKIGRIAPTDSPPAVPAGENVSPVGVSAVKSGDEVHAFIRSSGDQVMSRRSLDDARTWGKWTSADVTSTMPPSVASSAPRQVDLVTRSSSGSIVYSWFFSRSKLGQTDLGGPAMTAASVSSPGGGVVDVFALSPSGEIYRKHLEQTWTDWQLLSGGSFTSVPAASVDTATGQTVISARGVDGLTYERTVTNAGNGSGWTVVSGPLWSARAVGDRSPSRARTAASATSDGFVRLEQDGQVTSFLLKIRSTPDVVSRADGTWILFARRPNGQLAYYDARPGGFALSYLGGDVR